MKDNIRFLVMNDRAEFYGPGGWGEKESARTFDVHDALQMLKVFSPRASLIRVHVTEPEPKGAHAVAEFAGTAA
jgi:hypothetical protein